MTPLQRAMGITPRERMLIEFDYQGPDGIKTVKSDYGILSEKMEHVDGDPYSFIQFIESATSKVTLYRMTHMTRRVYIGGA